MVRVVLRRLGLVVVLLTAILSGVYSWAPQWLLEAEYARRAWVAGVEKHTIDAAGHRWSYYAGGRGPTVVLLHGFTGSKENWLDSARYLSERFHVVIPDLPGWGESERRKVDYRVAAQAERLTALFDALSLERPHLVGHSMGGHISGLFAAAHPDRLASLTFLSSAGVAFTENDFARRILAGETPFDFADRAEMQRVFADLFVQTPWLPDRVRDVLIARNTANHAFHAELLQQIKAEDQRFLLEAELPRLMLPVLVLWCSGDRVLDVSSIATFERLLPRPPQVQRLEQCGHMPMLERPAVLAAALADFLQSHKPEHATP